jgi:adenosylcobinamide amidohydrolase
VDVRQEIRTRREGGRELPLLLWRFPAPVRAIASAPHGGGLGLRRWVLNAGVPGGYSRRDPDRHLSTLAVSLGLPGRGVGMLTAADVRAFTTGEDGGVEVVATVGLTHPVLAAAPDDGAGELVGTINVLALVPAKLSDAALVNAVATVTEAKTQALMQAGHRATGTPTDAVCVVCTDVGHVSAFGGPRSVWGARLARAVHRAVLAGATT